MRAKISLLFLATLIFITAALPFARAQAQETAAAEEKSPSQIQKTINLLEDEKKRAEVVRLLKLMEAMEEESAAAPEADVQGAANEQPRYTPLQQETWSLKRYFSYKAGQAWRMVGVSGIGLKQSLKSFAAVMKALAEPQNFEMWRPYFLKAALWGLMCIVLIWGLLKRFGTPPQFVPELKSRLTALGRYLLLPALPCFLLALSLLPLPLLSTTAPGITADLGTGFAFIHSLIQHFFINLALLCIFLRLATVLLRPGNDGHSLMDINPLMARPILHSFNVVAAYMAVFIFLKGVVLEHFVLGPLYALTLVLMTVPIPVYLTCRILKMGRLLKFIDDGGEKRPPEPAPDRVSLEYRADSFIRRYWPPILIALVWLFEILAVFNPADAAERFVGRLMGTAVIIFLASLAIVIERRLMLNLVKRDSENGLNLLLSTDLVANAIVWLGALGLLVSLWGMPLESIVSNPITQEILGRALAIALTVAALLVFLKFSSLATNWLMSSRELYGNRNMRTMLPLVLTVVRTLAIFIGVVVILDRLGVNIGPILAGAGILSLGVGMGAQTLVKDVINGISILLMNTISVGDYVTMGGQSGTVEFLGLRTARLRDSSGNLIIVPNSSVTHIINMTRDYSQEVVELAVPANADPDEMLKLAREAADELSGDPAWKPAMTKPVEVVGISAFDMNSNTIRMIVNARAGLQWSVGRELRLRLRRRTRAEALKSPWFSYNLIVHNANDKRGSESPAETSGNQ